VNLSIPAATQARRVTFETLVSIGCCWYGDQKYPTWLEGFRKFLSYRQHNRDGNYETQVTVLHFTYLSVFTLHIADLFYIVSIEVLFE
jgi:hypothetical protein